ncbi:MAG: sensor histidine kinase [Planctomycetia bacterium]
MRTLGPAFLLALLLLGGLAWLAGRDAHAQRTRALEAEALTLAEALAAAAREASGTLAAAETHLAERLGAAARRAEALLQDPSAPTADLLERVAREERVGRIALLAPDGEVVVLVRHPAPLPATGEEAARLRAQAEALEREEVAAAGRALVPAPGSVQVEGLAAGALAARERFGLAYGRPGGGTLLLRAEAAEVVALRRRFGIAPLLERIGAQPGVRHARLLDEAGALLLGTPLPGPLPARAPAGPAAGMVEEAAGAMRAVLPCTLADGRLVRVDVALESASADASLAASQRVLALGVGLAALGLLGAGAYLGWRERRAREAERQQAVRREEEARLAQMGALAALVTHEISNPLNAVRLGLGLLPSLPPGEQGEVLQSLQEESARMGRTLSSFLELARVPAGARVPVGPALLERVRARIAAQAAARDVRVELDVAAGAPPVLGDPVLLEQALSSLARNALEASAPGGHVRLAWQAGAPGEACLQVDDRGPGFPAEGREALLRLGAVGRPGGHGLGLPLAARFVQQQGGRMLLLDHPAGGARVEVRLPSAAGAPHA